MNPFVSVIIPTHNRARLLERAVQSVLRQTFRDFEIIIIDDASTDETAGLVEQKFSHVPVALRYVRSEESIERSRARNRGIALAAGKLIACLDDDDEYLPEFLAMLAGYMREHPRIGLVFSDFFIVKDDGSVETGMQFARRYRPFSYQEWCLLGVVSPPCAAIFRREAFDRAGGFRQDLSPIEDREFFCRIAVRFPVHFIDKVSARHHVHAGSFSHIADSERAALKENIWKSIQAASAETDFQIRKAVSSRIKLNLAGAFLPDLGRTRAYLSNALRDEPLLYFSPDAWSLMARVVLPQQLYNWLKALRHKP